MRFYRRGFGFGELVVVDDDVVEGWEGGEGYIYMCQKWIWGQNKTRGKYSWEWKGT